MSRLFLNLSFVLSVAFLSGCSDSKNGNESPEDQPGLDSPVIIEQPGAEQPDDADSGSDAGNDDPDNSDTDPGNPDSETPDSDTDSESPATEDPVDTEEPVTVGDEITLSEAWAIYSQTGIWRSREKYLVDLPLSDVVDGATADQRYGAMIDTTEVFAISRSVSGQLLRTSCDLRETEELDPNENEGSLWVSSEEEDEDDEDSGCATPERRFYKLSDNALKMVIECENGSVNEALIERISASPDFSYGTLSFTADGAMGGDFENDVCGTISNTHNYWGQTSNPEALSSLISDTSTLEIKTNVRYLEGYLDAAVRIKADLELVDGLEIGREYPVEIDVSTDSPVIGSAQWLYVNEDDIDTSWAFIATGGSVTLLERSEHIAKVRFDFVNRDGQSLTGEMAVDLQ